jgi:hypothetical protein
MLFNCSGGCTKAPLIITFLRTLPVVFITQAEYVHSAVRTDCLDVIVDDLSLWSRKIALSFPAIRHAFCASRLTAMRGKKLLGYWALRRKPTVPGLSLEEVRNGNDVSSLCHYFHTPTYALVSYIIKSALIIYIKTLYSLIAPRCFDT